MNRFLVVCVALLVALWTAPIAAYFYYYPIYTYHYRLTLGVELPDGSARSGSSVVAVSEWRTRWWDFGAADAIQDRIVGESAHVDLGDGRMLVALLLRRRRPGDAPGRRRPGWGEGSAVGGSPSVVLARAYGVRGRGWEGGRRNELLSVLSRQRGVREIGPDDMPDLVTFADASDPRTVVEVDPRDLAASFGHGTRLRSVTIEITGAAVTQGSIEQRLPWLRDLGPKNLAGVQSDPWRPRTDLAHSIGRLSFKIRASDNYPMLH